MYPEDVPTYAYYVEKMALPIKEYYTIGVEDILRVKRFNTQATSYNVNFQNVDKVEDWFSFFPDLFDDLITRTTTGCTEQDRVGLEIKHPSLDQSVLVPFTAHKDLNADKVLSIIERVQQSKRSFAFNEGMSVKVIIVKDINIKKRS